MAGILSVENVPEVILTANAIPGLIYDRADDPAENLVMISFAHERQVA
jgi:hypothetical protein